MVTPVIFKIGEVEKVCIYVITLAHFTSRQLGDKVLCLSHGSSSLFHPLHSMWQKAQVALAAHVTSDQAHNQCMVLNRANNQCMLNQDNNQCMFNRGDT